ncbi:methionine synthase reductase [Exaiptasia diaphana]|uniref:Methionine synthase reductase n=1 Tax=Exaiptasia diaphana TaxID=2652724 RepID=A0A913XSV3_EXADI|nr:methionine synthase reductase [Exaiptasia diaphana]
MILNGFLNFFPRKPLFVLHSLLLMSSKNCKMPTSSHFTILYGSQTGQAQAIAEEIHENSSQHGLQSKLFCLSQTEKKFTLEKEPLIVFIVSTTGEGDPPDTMLKFMRRLKKKTLPSDHLKDCQYALLALGDTNYTNFCNNGKTLDRRLLALGAKQFYNSGYADDAVGLELVVDPWIDGLWNAVKKSLGLENGEKVCNEPTQNECENKPQPMTNGNDKKPLTVQNLEYPSDKEYIPEKNDNLPSKGLGNSSSLLTEDNHNSNSKGDTSPGQASTADLHLPSLRTSSETLSSSVLSIPVLSPNYLSVEYHTGESHESSPWYQDRMFSKATILSAKTLTAEDAIKTALEIELDITDCGLDYEPGDSFDVLCPNNQQEVTELMYILGLQDKADTSFSVNVMENTTKKTAVKPRYIPDPCTVKDAFLNCLEIRSVPKKAMIRMLVEYTKDPQEKRRLQELCSKQGASEYQACIRQPSISLLEILKAFPSCCPPFERLIEHLPQLSPRPYSVASSPLSDPNRLKFVFNIVEFLPYEDLRSSRLGVCTGWLSTVTENMRSDFADRLSQLQLCEQQNNPAVFVSARKHNQFRLPNDPKVPVVMIGPGTGVAPFVGFLEQRKCECKERSPKEVYGESLLFYGCRNRNQDFLYKEQLQDYHSSGVLSNLLVSFSREEGSTIRYVQDNLRLHAKEVAKMIFDEGGVVYVCGDAKNMAKDVFAVFCEIAEQHLGISKVDAISEMSKLRANKQYHEDVWT